MADWTTPAAIHSKSGETGVNVATRAIDEDINTFWNHAAGEPWIIFDMGKTMKITGLRLYQQGNDTYHFGKPDGVNIYIGDNPASLPYAYWEEFAANWWQERYKAEKQGRYMKLISLHPSTTQWLMEFDAYAESLADPPSNPLIGKPIVSPIIAAKPVIRLWCARLPVIR